MLQKHTTIDSKMETAHANTVNYKTYPIKLLAQELGAAIRLMFDAIGANPAPYNLHIVLPNGNKQRVLYSLDRLRPLFTFTSNLIMLDKNDDGYLDKMIDNLKIIRSKDKMVLFANECVCSHQHMRNIRYNRYVSTSLYSSFTLHSKFKFFLTDEFISEREMFFELCLSRVDFKSRKLMHKAMVRYLKKPSVSNSVKLWAVVDSRINFNIDLKEFKKRSNRFGFGSDDGFCMEFSSRLSITSKEKDEYMARYTKYE
jgi:hypothetical protein